MLGCGHAGRGRPGPSPHQSRDQHQERAGGAETRHGEDSISGKSACVRACTCPCCPLLPPVNSSRKTKSLEPEQGVPGPAAAAQQVPHPDRAAARAGSGPRSCGSLGNACKERTGQDNSSAGVGLVPRRRCRASGMEVVPLPCRLKENPVLSLFFLFVPTFRSRHFFLLCRIHAARGHRTRLPGS